MTLRILLLQARNEDDPMRLAERQSFAEKTGLQLDQIVPHDLLAGPPGLAALETHDALMVGGSGDYYVSNRSLPHFEAQMDFLREVVDRGHPMFASCFGFQILVAALGGEVTYDPESMEVGTYQLTVSEAGRVDPLMGRLPKVFDAQMGRKDRASRLPPGVVNLASSERNPYQALRVPDKPIWATQFHPELDLETNLERFFRYLEGYAELLSLEEQRLAAENFRESPHTEALLPGFLDLVFG
jgi:GMP synthase (glutamine-hydrolysing)